MGLVKTVTDTWRSIFQRGNRLSRGSYSSLEKEGCQDVQASTSQSSAPKERSEGDRHLTSLQCVLPNGSLLTAPATTILPDLDSGSSCWAPCFHPCRMQTRARASLFERQITSPYPPSKGSAVHMTLNPESVTVPPPPQPQVSLLRLLPLAHALPAHNLLTVEELAKHTPVPWGLLLPPPGPFILGLPQNIRVSLPSFLQISTETLRPLL